MVVRVHLGQVRRPRAPWRRQPQQRRIRMAVRHHPQPVLARLKPQRGRRERHQPVPGRARRPGDGDRVHPAQIIPTLVPRPQVKQKPAPRQHRPHLRVHRRHGTEQGRKADAKMRRTEKYRLPHPRVRRRRKRPRRVLLAGQVAAQNQPSHAVDHHVHLRRPALGDPPPQRRAHLLNRRPRLPGRRHRAVVEPDHLAPRRPQLLLQLPERLPAHPVFARQILIPVHEHHRRRRLPPCHPTG